MKFLIAAVFCAGAATALPNFHGCSLPEAQSEDYCDNSLPVSARVDALLDSLTLSEKISSSQPYDNGNVCGTTTGGIERLGLPEYTWLIETNTNVASACLDELTCATCFIGPMGMGSSFNRTNWQKKGEVFGTEMRAFNNLNELPGEDPFLNGEYASHMVQGMQEEDANGHPKMIAYVKHLTAYSTETNRGHDDYTISPHDLFESYLPAYEKAFIEGKASGAMCSYNAINGSPSCANSYLNNEVVRGWNPDIHITTDCGAVGNLKGDPVNAGSDENAAAMAMNGGADIDMGDLTMTQALENATHLGLLEEGTIDAAWKRSFTPLFRAGRFDPVDEIEWSKYGKESINNEEHQAISLDAALMGQILLANDGVLPLQDGLDVAVVGPMAEGPEKYLSSYAADDICYDGSHSCMTSIYEAIKAENANGATSVAQGCDVSSNSTDGFDEALSIAKAADIVILAVGIDNTVEHEGQDRDDTALPGVQEDFALKVLALGKPVVMVMVNGGGLAIDNLVDSPNAIIEAFNPAVMGPKALALQIYGSENRWGKLPVTLYPHSFVEEQPMANYDMSLSPGRTYRYYEGQPLWSFGHGLSLTDFTLECEKDGEDQASATCDVANIGPMDGDEVVFVFHTLGDELRKEVTVNHPVPIKSLVDFGRISVLKGEEAGLSFTFSEDIFKVVNEAGDKVLYKGRHTLVFSRGHGDEVHIDYDL
ncbi:hypothetical protein TL16_g00169 [Triparma laevis f. inornata]|uniref:Fibronectin type III-like domain-containing protein n=1 Tax=Triparma laevis f. inornata TaxID=1714386 RepID=A0A9W6Z5Y4_9STRA|nr:hypothetical protein TL16_g00169 [Triparma laevis f. inornata]